MIDSLAENDDYKDDLDLIKQLSLVKNKEVLRETLLEFDRKGSFVCIFPAKGCEMYDQFFN